MRRVRGLKGAAALAALLLVAAGGCTWFTGEERDVRVSPYIRDLSVTPSAVIYGEPMSIRFRFDDPQGDIDELIVRFQSISQSVSFEQRPLWENRGDQNNPKSGDLFLTTAGQATYYFSFSRIGANHPQGEYLVQVTVEDRKGHVSNVLTDTVLLQSF